MTAPLTDEELAQIRANLAKWTSLGDWEGERLIVEIDRLRALERDVLTQIDERCREYAEEHDRQCRASQAALEASEHRTARLEALLREARRYVSWSARAYGEGSPCAALRARIDAELSREGA